MESHAILAASIALQFLAVLLALRLMWVMRWWGIGVLVVSAIALMTGRRTVTLIHHLTVETDYNADPVAETIALVISCLMVAAFAMVMPRLRHIMAQRRSARDGETRVRAIMDNVADGIITTDAHCVIETMNKTAERLLECRPEEAIGQSIEGVFSKVYCNLPDGETPLSAVDWRAKLGEAPQEVTIRAGSGTERVLDITVNAVELETARHFIVSFSDITRRKQVEQGLRKSQDRLSEAQRIARIGNWETDFRTGTGEWSSELFRIFGLERTAGPPTYEEFLDRVHPDDRAKIAEARERAFRLRQPYDLDFRIIRPDGSGRIIHSRAVLHTDDEGAPVKLVGTSQDVTAAREAERERQMHASQMRGLIEHAPLSLVFKDVDGRILVVNKTFEQHYGVTAEELYGRRLSGVLPREYGEMQAALDGEIVETRRTIQREAEVTFADGTVHRLAITKFPVLDGSGELMGIGAIADDVTERRRAEEVLHHTQKMEAIGQLTGGVAHDFNNLLTAVLGNLQMLEPYLEGNEAALRHVSTALRATNRGADLTHRLLSFARKQSLDPVTMDINELVEGMTELIQRTIGDDIAVALVMKESGSQALVDRNQLENVLLNLAVNARDAMPEGGRLTIETADAVLDEDYARHHNEVQPGRYVMIAVSDTGSGMPPDVVEHAFEPFYTTKGQGKGTGLGLSMAYGFTKQSGGHIKIYSEAGHGTTIKVYLPTARGAAVEDTERRAGDRPLPTGHEALMLVEDDEDVREFLLSALESFGYQVTPAPDGPAALDRLGTLAHLDLLVTDVIMPGGMNGAEVAAAVRTRFPGLPVVFVSGYAENALTPRREMFGEGARFLGKPCTREDLARTVRAVLDDQVVGTRPVPHDALTGR